MVFQTLTMPGDGGVRGHPGPRINDASGSLHPGWPKMAFIEHRFSGDPTNWWVPNHAGVEAMLRSSGLRVIARPAEEIYICEPDPEAAAQRWHSDAQLQSLLGVIGDAQPSGG